jgi:hypothetical protein
MGLLAASMLTVSCSTSESTAPLSKVNAKFANTGTVCEDHPELCEPTSNLKGRMTGGGGQVTIGDVYITRGFTIHCDITLSNNLEIYWPGNKWHIDKPLTSAECIDDPDVSPVPPEAPFDTFIGEGVGRLNGVDGSLVRFIFVDTGERGAGPHDRSQIQIWAPDGTLVLDVPLSSLTKGNIQAHEDQPHK